MAVTRLGAVSTAVILVFFGTALPSQRAGSASAPTFTRVHDLLPQEGVFAYSRISPDGRFLAYASQFTRPGQSTPTRTVNVVDLAKRSTVFSEAGIDAYWSPDGQRLIFLSHRDPSTPQVSLWHLGSGETTRGIAPVELGDYYSWGSRNGRDLILTINGHYYFLDGTHAQLPAQSIPRCPGIGTGERPLLSRDGRRVTTFVSRRIVVRNLTDCQDVVETGIAGSKADFSSDGRYIAFHAPKTDSTGYEVQVIDLEQRTLRRITRLAGSSFFPSWTNDGRLSFRYDGPEYSGFMLASNVLLAAESPLPPPAAAAERRVVWTDLFKDPLPSSSTALVLVWATWSAHSADALRALQEFAADSSAVSIATAVDSASRPLDVRRIRTEYQVQLPQLGVVSSARWRDNTAVQMPVTFAFIEGVLEDERLGAQSRRDLIAWMEQLQARR